MRAAISSRRGNAQTRYIPAMQFQNLCITSASRSRRNRSRYVIVGRLYCSSGIGPLDVGFAHPFAHVSRRLTAVFWHLLTACRSSATPDRLLHARHRRRSPRCRLHADCLPFRLTPQQHRPASLARQAQLRKGSSGVARGTLTPALLVGPLRQELWPVTPPAATRATASSLRARR